MSSSSPPSAWNLVNWLLGAETAVFGSLALLAAQQFRHLSSNSSNSSSGMAGGRMRDLFVALLSCGCLARAVSLGVVLYTIVYGASIPGFTRYLAPDASAGDAVPIESFNAVNAKLWALYLLEALPSLVFLAAYSLVVLFWAQVFYATILVAADSLRSVFVVGNFLLGMAFGVSVWSSAMRRDARLLQASTAAVSGVGYVLVGVFFAYYGVQVASQLSSGEPRHTRTRVSIVRRIVLLSVVCPLLFEVRGVVALASVLTKEQADLLPAGLNPWGWDAIVYLITELLPVALILQVFSPPQHVNAEQQQQQQQPSERLQTPLLNSSFVESFRQQQWTNLLDEENSRLPEIRGKEASSRRPPNLQHHPVHHLAHHHNTHHLDSTTAVTSLSLPPEASPKQQQQTRMLAPARDDRREFRRPPREWRASDEVPLFRLPEPGGLVLPVRGRAVAYSSSNGEGSGSRFQPREA